jgi:hypothetical protein
MALELLVALLAFMALASGVLMWDGLAAAVGHARELDAGELRRARLRLAAGAAGVAVVLWLAFGLVTRAR